MVVASVLLLLRTLSSSEVLTSERANLSRYPAFYTEERVYHDAGCSPKTLDARVVEYPSNHRFYHLLQSLDPPFTSPVFYGRHAHLCDPHGTECGDRGWSYCLPITARREPEYCRGADRMELLVPQSTDTLCYGSVLHMLLVDVYAVFKEHATQPAVLFGSLLGAVRNGSMIPFTEDADIGYRYSDDVNLHAIKYALWHKGYHLFRQNILRVCVAPTHPLASNLYDRYKAIDGRMCHVPYVDVYQMERAENLMEWHVEEIKNKRRVPNIKFEPYSQVTINGIEFDTVADPVDFLEQEYGKEWRVPRRRGLPSPKDENARIPPPWMDSELFESDEEEIGLPDIQVPDLEEASDENER
ncbi:hypothetical protein Poli38472_014745 [Pythium oligandrum]|uniref:Kringle domain-containing protein n=1 Tax=Pythium oligandrum TaxID=41045 RepID=A0A8K1FBM4_PYTOL|nr:hypothetical protein Poli38472_014745 [Pythium oligandrum]|eukprot:TMW54974.1 hypothetical protein Poli38472_014745 [Pythium oligandrum]